MRKRLVYFQILVCVEAPDGTKATEMEDAVDIEFEVKLKEPMTEFSEAELSFVESLEEDE